MGTRRELGVNKSENFVDVICTCTQRREREGHLGSEEGAHPIHPLCLSVCLSASLPLCLKRTDSIQTLCGRSGCSSSRWLASGQMPAGQTQFHSLATPYEAASMIHIFVSNIITNNNHLKSIHPTLKTLLYEFMMFCG